MENVKTNVKDIVEEIRQKIFDTLRAIIVASGGILPLGGQKVRVSMYDKYIEERHEALVVADSLTSEKNGEITFSYLLDGRQYEENLCAYSLDELQRITDLVI